MNERGLIIIIGLFGLFFLISISFFKKLEKIYGSKKAVKYSILTLLTIALIGISFYWFSTSPCPNCGCDNVDDCISKYKFEEARKYAAVSDEEKFPTETKKVAYSEAEYWINEKDFAKALPLAKEVGDKELLTLLNEIITKKIELNQIEDVQIYYLSFPERTFEKGLEDIWDNENSVAFSNKIKYDLSLKIIKKFCNMKMFEKAESFLNSIPETIIISSAEKNLQDSDEKLYYSIKKQFNENQKFYEPWQGYIPGYYHIVTYKYPRKEALKIINDYLIEKNN